MPAKASSTPPTSSCCKAAGRCLRAREMQVTSMSTPDTRTSNDHLPQWRHAESRMEQAFHLPGTHCCHQEGDEAFRIQRRRPPKSNPIIWLTSDEMRSDQTGWLGGRGRVAARSARVPSAHSPRRRCHRSRKPERSERFFFPQALEGVAGNHVGATK